MGFNSGFKGLIMLIFNTWKVYKINDLISLEETGCLNNSSLGLRTRDKLKMNLHALSFRS